MSAARDFAPALASEAPAIKAFLAGHAESSMFLRGNLRAHGPCGGDAPHATRMWLRRGAGGAIDGVVGLSASGHVQVQVPGLDREARLDRLVANRDICGLNGGAGQARIALEAMGLSGAPARLAHDEPLYRLRLGDLAVPPGGTGLRAPQASDRETLEAWRRAYHIEVLGTPPEETAACAAREISGLIARDALRVLHEGGRPVAMTAFNAALPDMVQIGNVYTPPASRGRGLARRAVALHLSEARRAGVTDAVLFASGAAACRAYEAVGFRRVGSYLLLIFDGPQRVRPRP